MLTEGRLKTHGKEIPQGNSFVLYLKHRKVESRYIPISGISGSYGSSIFSFLRNQQLFSTVATPIYIPTRVPFSPHRHQHLLFVDFLTIAILTGMK